MPCKKSELVAAINSYATARVTNDNLLIQSSATIVQSLLETLDYAEEEVTAEPQSEPEGGQG